MIKYATSFFVLSSISSIVFIILISNNKITSLTIKIMALSLHVCGFKSFPESRPNFVTIYQCRLDCYVQNSRWFPFTVPFWGRFWNNTILLRSVNENKFEKITVLGQQLLRHRHLPGSLNTASQAQPLLKEGNNCLRPMQLMQLVRCH
jgi:hypothetical protein